MFNYIFRFFNVNKKEQVFDKQYRNGYNKLWINNLKNFYP
jgi:hypothetical protein